MRDIPRKGNNAMMTQIQKAEILNLRKQNFSYSQIGKKLSLSPNTVKSVCQRAIKSPGKNGLCLNCGEPIFVNPKAKPRQFCSDSCRIAHWRKSNGKKGTEYHLICLHCGSEFVTFGNKRQKYCSHKCYISHRFGGHIEAQ